MRTVVYTSDKCLGHDTGSNHPDQPARLKVVLDLIKTEFSEVPVLDAPLGALDIIALAHPYEHINEIKEKVPEEGHVHLNPDTVLSPGTWEAALSCVGAACQAVDDIVSNKITRAFCATRPGGHHAEKSSAMGFCLFCQTFIAARYAQEKYNIKKVAIIDFDVHHGNGTNFLTRSHNEEYPDKPIFFASTHQDNLWPRTGPSRYNNEFIVNIPIPEGSGHLPFWDAYAQSIFPAIKKYAPDLLILSAGFDAHKNDPLANINLEEKEFKWITKELCKIADEFCEGRVISCLEGGYNLEALKDSVRVHLEALCTYPSKDKN